MILVAGIVNIETTVRIEHFPIEYAKSRFTFHGITDRLGGVGYNVAAGLARAVCPVRLAAMTGPDLAGGMITQALQNHGGIDLSCLLPCLSHSLRSTILVDESGRGAMFTDLKESQQIQWPVESYDQLFAGCDLAHCSNINWALELAHEATQRGLPVSTDVQAIADVVDDAYNRRFLAIAELVFLSAENLQLPPAEALATILHHYPVQLAVATLGQHGCMALGRGWPSPVHQAAQPIARLANVTGAGDAFAAGFLSELSRRGVARQAVAPMPPHMVEAAMAAGQAAAAKKIAG